MISVTALQQKQQNYLCRFAFHVNGLFVDGLYSGIGFISQWVTPPVSLFLGLIFALVCGQAYPKFNKKVSKYLLQYSVVGLGFGYESSGFSGFR